MFNPDNWGCPSCGEPSHELLLMQKDQIAQINSYSVAFDPLNPQIPLMEDFYQNHFDEVYDSVNQGLECPNCGEEGFLELCPVDGTIDKVLFEKKKVDPELSQLMTFCPEPYRIVVLQPSGIVQAWVNSPLPAPGGWTGSGDNQVLGSLVEYIEEVPNYKEQLEWLYQTHTECTGLPKRFTSNDLDRALWFATVRAIHKQRNKQITQGNIPHVDLELFHAVSEARLKLEDKYDIYVDPETGFKKIGKLKKKKKIGNSFSSYAPTSVPVRGPLVNAEWWSFRTLTELYMVKS